MKIENLRSLIKESIQGYIKEIDEAADNAATEARISKCDQAIAERETKLNNLEESELRELMDDNKIKELHNEIKELKKAKAKFEKQKEKKAAKHAKKSAPKEDVVTDTEIEEAPIATEDIMAEMGTEEAAINESFLKMQKLAGVITETQYNEKKNLIENGAVTTNPSDITLNPSDTNFNTASEKEDPNIKVIMTRLKSLTPQLKANDTTVEFTKLIEAIMSLIQDINKNSLTDTEIMLAINKILQNKRKEMSMKK